MADWSSDADWSNDSDWSSIGGLGGGSRWVWWEQAGGYGFLFITIG